MSEPEEAAPIVFLDTETDGVHPDRRPWEIAMIRREPDGTQTEREFFVEIDLDTADPFGLRVGRFYDRHPLGRYLSQEDYQRVWPDETGDFLTVAEAVMVVARWTHGAHVAGAVPNFDTETLAPILRFWGLTPAWHYHLVDVENLAVGFLAARGEPIQPPWKSDDLAAALGVDPGAPEEKHTALGDARWAMRIYDAVMSGGPA